MKVLTKSNYLLGLECPRYLWSVVNKPDVVKGPSVSDKFNFEQGDLVGQLAKNLFPEGVDLPTDYIENIKKSEEFLNSGKPLFEAGFEFNNCFSRADVLVPSEDGWDIVEVKSATKTKDVNIHDVSFQKYVYEGKGLKINKTYLLHLNNEFVKNGEIDFNELFVREDVTEQVEEAVKDIDKRILDVFSFISSPSPPDAALAKAKLVKDGFHDCIKDGCVSLPENHVFCLYRGGKLSCELFENGFEVIKDIPEDVRLNGKQKIQRECELSGEVYVDRDGIKNFLGKLEYPIHYLDFETFSTAIPMFDGLKPYSVVPFQFSLHVDDKENVNHYEFLYEGSGDPRREFLEALKESLGDSGSVVVYNQSFEIGRLKELAEAFPEHKKWIENVLKRIIDLLIPFREFSYYNPKQQGSASIKKVLPALCGKSYEGMEIGDGGTASVKFYNMAYNNGKDVREALLKYCELDTLAEVMIVEKLREIVG